jgi:hypothetical protein
MGYLAELDLQTGLPSPVKGRHIAQARTRKPAGSAAVPGCGLRPRPAARNAERDARQTRRRDARATVSRIEHDTPLVPRAVAEGVWEEASVLVKASLPRSWMVQLTERAETVYEHNRRFRSLIRARGNHGREWLWSFMRHWLAALIQAHRPDLKRRLPAAYPMARAINS